MGESIKYNVDFLFNAELAEQVAAGNYTPAVQGIGVEEEIIVTDDSVEKIIYSHPYHAYIGDATTDNFGNQLMKGKYYIPVVLCVSGEEEENRDKYKSVISMYELTTPFKYSPIV